MSACLKKHILRMLGGSLYNTTATNCLQSSSKSFWICGLQVTRFALSEPWNSTLTTLSSYKIFVVSSKLVSISKGCFVPRLSFHFLIGKIEQPEVLKAIMTSAFNVIIIWPALECVLKLLSAKIEISLLSNVHWLDREMDKFNKKLQTKGEILVVKIFIKFFWL